MARGTLDVERAVHQPQALAHAHQAEASPASGFTRVEPDTVVPDGQEQAAVHLPQDHARRVRAGVAGHVVQRFLGHPIQAERGVLPEGGRHRVEVQRDVDASVAAPPFAFRAKRLGQAELFEHRRMQLVCERVNVLAEANESLANGP